MKKEAKPLISVIIPTLNEEKYIGKTLQSLKSQTFKYYEIIVVDGGSKDKTIEIAKKYGARVLVTKDPRNPSQPRDMNFGAENSKGEILVFTDADTIRHANYLEIIRREFEDKDTVLIFGPGFPYDGTLIVDIEYLFWNILRGFLALLPKKLKRPMPPGYNMAFRKSAFFKIGKLNEDLIVNNDGEIGSRAIGAGKIKFVPQMVVRNSARRYKKLGFFKYNKFYLYVLGNIFYFMRNWKFYKRLWKRSADSFKPVR
jgi:glycosyltransferase involved in cell wall biosynthesis